MLNNLKTFLLASTMLVSGFLFGQNKDLDQAQEQNTKNNKSEKVSKFNITAGALNVRTSDELVNLTERAFVKSTYQLNDRWSVSAEIGTSQFVLADERVYTLSPSVTFKDKGFQINGGFFGINNEVFVKADYTPNNGKTNFSLHAQNLSKPGPQANFLPEIPENLNMAVLALAEQKMLIYKKEKIKLGATVGLGSSMNTDQDVRLAYKALFAATYGDITLGMGVQPVILDGFADPKATVLLKYKL